MEDQYPKPVSDPAAAGIPEYADDDSQAWDDVESGRVADGTGPAPLPPDRDDGPLAIDEYGTTPGEQRRGEPMDLRLAREEPDVTPDDVTPGEATPDAAGAWAVADVGPDEPPSPDPTLDETPVDPHLNSAVSMYDRPEPGIPSGDRVGRLVAPDEIGYDVGASGGGASAEELAMHQVPED